MTSRSKRIVTAIAIVAVSTWACIAQAATYNITNDFSVAANPNGVWTYGYANTLGGSLTFYDVGETLDGGLQRWSSSVVQFLGSPSVANNPTAAGAGGVPAYTTSFHPGPNNEYSTYRFTSPDTAQYNLSAVFGPLNSGGTDVHILLNGSSLFSAPIYPGAGASYNTVLSLIAGDRVEFTVGFGSNGNFFSDNTSIDATLTQLTQTPLPAALPLFLGGVGAMAWAARRRKQKLEAA